jgi:RHS repeat-associated protein
MPAALPGNLHAFRRSATVPIAFAMALSEAGTIVGAYYKADVLTANDYYPFGMQMPGRKFSIGGYRYGFNGKENDKDISEGGQDYGMRIYDGRIGRFLSVDPMTKSFPLLSPFQFAANSPIFGIDMDGMEFMKYLSAWFHISTEVTNTAGDPIPFAVSCFDQINTKVVINPSNLPSIYKDAVEQPLFNALGVGITPQGKREATDYPQMSDPGFSNIQTKTDWAFSPPEDFKEDIYDHSGGTKPGFNKAFGYYEHKFEMDYRAGGLNSFNKGLCISRNCKVWSNG